MSVGAREQAPNQRLALLLPPLAIALIALLVIFFVVFQTSVVDGSSMAPTLDPEDRLLVTRGYDDPMRGDIVVVDVPGDRGGIQTVVKRVVALAGDTVHTVGDTVLVNGQAPHAPGAVIGKAVLPEAESTVPAGQVFLLGDNRPVSYDSRFHGTVPLQAIHGRAVFIYSPVTRIRPVDGSPDRD